MGIKGVIVSWLEDTYKPLNDSEIFTDFLKATKEMNVSVIVSLSPGCSSVWFERSEGKDDNFTDYYIWTDSKGQNASGNPEPPNNWVFSLNYFKKLNNMSVFSLLLKMHRRGIIQMCANNFI